MPRQRRRIGRSLKPFRWPRLWAGLWMLALAAVVAASLLPAGNLPGPPLAHDKLLHFLGYFGLMAGAVQLHARLRAWVMVALALMLCGIGLEWLQGWMSLGRSPDRGDALANVIGVLAGLATGFTPLRDILLRLEGGRRG
ncbi:VanZ family protein [Luteimonas sp. e5]